MCVWKPAHTEKFRSGCWIVSLSPDRWVYLCGLAGHHQPEGEVSQRLGYLSSPERSITSPPQLKYMWGADKIWGKDWDSINFRIMSFVLEQTHRHSVYLHLHMYVCELFLPNAKRQQDQVIYIFDKNIKTYLREVENPVFLLCRGCWD